MIVNLPVTKKKVKLRFQSARMLDNIKVREKEVKSKCPDLNEDLGYLYTLTYSIDTVDDKKVEPHKLEAWVRKLPLRDSNLLVQRISKLNACIGVKTSIPVKCGGCGGGYTIPFRFNSEFFGPSEE